MSKKGDEQIANVQQKRVSEYPKYVEDPDGGRVRVENEVQEACVKKGEPFPVDERSKKEKKKSGPQEYPKMVEDPDGKKRTVRNKEEEHAVRNGEKWVNPEAVEEGIVAKAAKGPQEYPKMIKVGDETIKVRNAQEEALALGEDIDDGEGNTDVDFEKMTKKQLEAYAKKHFNVDIDRRKKQAELAAEVAELASKAQESKDDFELEDLDEEQLVSFAKENFDADLDVEMGKEALIEEIDKLIEEADLLGE